MKNIKEPENIEEVANKKSTTFDILLFFPEGVITIVFLLACPIQAVILFMHNRVTVGIFLMTCAAACIYSFIKLMEKQKKYFAFCVLNIYTVISFLIGMH